MRADSRATKSSCIGDMTVEKKLPLRRSPLDQQIRLLRLSRHSQLRRRQADRHRPGRLGPQDARQAGLRADRRVHEAPRPPVHRGPLHVRRRRPRRALRSKPRASGSGSRQSRSLRSEDMDPIPATSWRSCSAISAKASSGRSSASRAATTIKKTENKGYNERLADAEVHGVRRRKRGDDHVRAGPGGRPRHGAVRRQVRNPRRQAIIAGQQVIEKFNCTGCHTLDMERWDLAYEPGRFRRCGGNRRLSIPQAALHAAADRPLRKPTPAAHACTRVHRHAAGGRTGKPYDWTRTGDPIEPDDTAKRSYSFVLWANALLDGKPWLAGLQNC